MSNSRGFSLVELLIAMTIMTMVLFIGTMAYQQYSQYWQKELGDFEQKLSTAKSVSQFYNAIKHIRPHMVRIDEERWAHYFDGAQTIIRSVTSKSVSSPQHAAIFELIVRVDGEEQELVYREKPIAEVPFIALEQADSYSYEIKLDIQFDELTFEFFGWRHVDEYFSSMESGSNFQQDWFGAYSGRDTLVTPNVVRVALLVDGVKSQLDIPLAHFIPEYVQSYGQGDD